MPAASGADHPNQHIDQEILVDMQTPGDGSLADAGYFIDTLSPRMADTMSKPVKRSS
jgi:hypothetical protein